MQLNPSEISELLKSRIQGLGVSADIRTQGTVVTVTDGICRVHGLSDVMQGEMLEFPGDTFGLALNLERDSVGSVILGDYEHIREGDTVKSTGRILEVPIGPELIGRVVNSLGQPIDGKGPINAKMTDVIEKVAPGVIARKSVSQPVQTGLKAIDAMVPIGRGQRELIIGDRQTGKTAVAVDTIINSKGKDLICIYVAIGQKASTIANVVRKLEETGAMAYTIVVAATASESAAMQYIAPYSGCTMGEYFRDRGQDALIIYDDLTKQAWAYRQVSLLLRRPPGREAYPGDVFYLHSRLLERAARVNEAYVEKFTNGEVKGKTGSLTALPIIETQAGDVTAFVPTNVISITDGQIFLETDLFNAGIRPAINAGISVSRVGGAAQTKVIKKLGGGVRLALAQFRELAAFAQFASDLDEATRKQLERGRMVTELMKQPQYQPLAVWEQAVTLFAANNGHFDDIDIKQALAAEKALREFLRSKHAALVERIESTKDLSKDDEAALTAAIQEFKKTGTYLHLSSPRSLGDPATFEPKGTGFPIRGNDTAEATMPSTKEIRLKIKSVQSTRKITKAMEMVAASKMRKAQERMRQARPYGDRIRNIVAHLAQANPEYKHPFVLRRSEIRNVGVILVSTDKGLCGGLNTNIQRALLQLVKQWEASGVKFQATAVGNRGFGFMQRLNANIVSHVVQLGDKPHLEKLIGPVKVQLDGYAAGTLDALYIAYTRFINTMKQEPVIEQLLPLSAERFAQSEAEKRAYAWDYIYEPDAQRVIDELMTRYVEAIIYQAVAENMASEQSARMVAMKAASDNAKKIIEELQLIYNKTRQAGITKEISEIVGGAAAIA
jgi:F-type H+/Na+-transporting ATPase subunit alpha